MKKSILFATILSSVSIMAQNKITYPETKKTDYKELYFGTEVKDPFRWLEDDRSAETEAWVKDQNIVTNNYLEKIPYRKNIKSRMQKLWNFEKVSAPFIEGNYTYFYKNNGLQNQAVLYRKNVSGVEEVFLDPNTFSTDGTTSLAGINFTVDGTLAAYQISEAGSDWRKIIVLNAVTKEKIDETIVDVKFSDVSWFKNEGFYYSSYDKPSGSELSAKTDQHKLYYHKLGTFQKDDKVVFGNNIKRRYIGAQVTKDNFYLVITAANETSSNELYLVDLTKPNFEIKTLVNTMFYDYEIIDNSANRLFVLTNDNAPNKKLMIIDGNNPEMPNWLDLIPETENVLSVTTGGNYIFANYMKDAISEVKQYDYDGALISEVKLPGIGTTSGFSGKSDDKKLFFNFTNYITPSSIYTYDVITSDVALYQKPFVDFKSEKFESKQVFYTSKDGTKIPMIITHKKGLKLNGKNPTILYGYGGFNISLTPSFNIANAVWLENGGVYVVANLRGGGEYGKQWHEAGTQLKKQNVFDDFIAAAEYLIGSKYTSSQFLAIKGASNGGLLVGATMLQRPELFKVALPAVGVLDMLRYHTFTAGAGWAYDYGTSEQSEEMFNYIRKYSPVQNVKKMEYPATLITTGDHDDRVVPAHSFKFAAELQDKQQGTNPTLIRIDINAGHGAGKSTESIINEHVDIQAFTLFNMGIKKVKKKK